MENRQGRRKRLTPPKKSTRIEDVWTTYVEVMEPRRRELDPESRRIIRDALKVADVAELKRAIVGNMIAAPTDTKGNRFDTPTLQHRPAQRRRQRAARQRFAALLRHRRARPRARRPRLADAVLARMARSLRGARGSGATSRFDRRGRGNPGDSQPSAHRGRPAGGQHGARRRADPRCKRLASRAVAVATYARALGRCGRQRHDRRGGPHAWRARTPSPSRPAGCFP